MFVSTYDSAIDAKGRVSIPASFRAALGGGNRVFLWPALDGSGCLEGGGEALMATYRQMLLRLAPQSPARIALVEGVFSSAADLKMDDPGRIKLPAALKAEAGLSDRVVFSGLLDSFRIWSPEAHAAHKARQKDELAKSATLQELGRVHDEIQRLQDGFGVAPRLVDGEGH